MRAGLACQQLPESDPRVEEGAARVRAEPVDSFVGAWLAARCGRGGPPWMNGWVASSSQVQVEIHRHSMVSM